MTETLSTEWKPGYIRVPDLDKLERWRERKERFEDRVTRSMARGGSSAADNFMCRLELREEREACYHEEYSPCAECEMRLKARYTAKGKMYEREVTLVSDSDSVPEKVRLKCDRKEPGNVLEASADDSDFWFWFWLGVSILAFLASAVVIGALFEKFPVTTLAVITAILITVIAIAWRDLQAQ